MKLFQCTDCGKRYTSASAFCDHFLRAAGSIVIIGCKKSQTEK